MMSRSFWLLCVLVVLTWLTISGLRSDQGFSTRKPGAWEYGSEDDADDDRDVSHNNNDDDDDDGDEDDGDEPELLISSVLMKPYLEKHEGDGEEFEGVIPDLLKAICESGHMTCDYQIELAADGLFGSRDNQGHWTGLIGEVKRGEVDLAAAPIKISLERLAVVNFSIPFAETALTVLVNRDDGVQSIEEILSRNITLGGVNGGSSLEKLRNQPQAPYSAMWAAIESTGDTKVSNMEDGIKRVLAGGYAFICETDMARYYTSRHCSLGQIKESFLPDKGHAFAFPKDNDNLEVHINVAIKALKQEGKIDEIYDKWFDSTCGASSVRAIQGALLSAFVAVLLLH